MKTSGIDFCSSSNYFSLVNYYTTTLIFSPNALTVQTAKNHKESPFSHRRKLCHGRCVGVT